MARRSFKKLSSLNLSQKLSIATSLSTYIVVFAYIISVLINLAYTLGDVLTLSGRGANMKIWILCWSYLIRSRKLFIILLFYEELNSFANMIAYPWSAARRYERLFRRKFDRSEEKSSIILEVYLLFDIGKSIAVSWNRLSIAPSLSFDFYQKYEIA